MDSRDMDVSRLDLPRGGAGFTGLDLCPLGKRGRRRFRRGRLRRRGFLGAHRREFSFGGDSGGRFSIGLRNRAGLVGLEVGDPGLRTFLSFHAERIDDLADFFNTLESLAAVNRLERGRP